MFEEFNRAFCNRYDAIRQREDQSQKVIGWVCIYVPEEIIYAGGMLPFRVIGGEGKTEQADAYLYSNICSFIRSCLEEGFRKKYDFLDGFITCNNCDHVRRLYDVWSHYLKTPFIRILTLPHKISPSSLEFFTIHLRRFKEELQDFFGVQLSDESLCQAIEVYNKTRRLLRDLYELRKASSPPISGAESLEIVRAGMVMPRDKYNQLLEDLLRDIKNRGKVYTSNIRLMVMGSELDNPEYLKVIEDLGALVVADNLCFGSRYFWDLVEVDGNPLEALAKRYLTHAPCPRMYPPSNRFDYLRKMIEDFRVDGIIYQAIKFCDMYGIEPPIARANIEELGIPILFLDREYPLAGVGQMRTRVQAFLEKFMG